MAKRDFIEWDTPHAPTWDLRRHIDARGPTLLEGCALAVLAGAFFAVLLWILSLIFGGGRYNSGGCTPHVASACACGLGVEAAPPTISFVMAANHKPGEWRRG